MDQSFKNLVDSANSLLILLPANPTLDEVAASLGLYLSLKGVKEAVISSPTPMRVEFNHLVGVNKITPELGSKNLIIKFADYRATDIERVSYNIENGEFNLTVIPKPGVNAPQKDQIIHTYAGVSADTVIMVGGRSRQDFPALDMKELAGAKLAHLGIAALPDLQGQLMGFDRSASSVSEAVALVTKESGYALDPDIATNYLAGLEQGSNHFASANVNADTFQLAADFLRAGARKTSPSIQPSDFPAGAIPTVGPEPAPEDWMETPKIYKGTSVS